MHIPEGRQVGGVPLEEGRLARIETTIGQILMVHVFTGEDESPDFADKLAGAIKTARSAAYDTASSATKEADWAPPEGMPKVEANYRKFARELDDAIRQAGRSNKEKEYLQKAWASLKAEFADASVKIAGFASDDAPQPWSVALYVLAVRALLQAILDDVLSSVLPTSPDGTKEYALDDDENDEDDPADDDYLDVLKFDSDGVACNEHVVRREIQQRLRFWVYRIERSKEADEAAELMACVPQFAIAIFEALVNNMPGASFGVERHAVPGRSALDGKPITVRRLRLRQLAGNASLAERIRRALTFLPVTLTWQPLNEAPRYVNEQDDSSLLPLVQYRSSNRFLRDFHRRNSVSQEYVDAINAQQSVPWRMNRELYKIANNFIELAKVRDGEPSPTAAWVLRHFYRPAALRGRRLTLPGEMLDHVLARRALDELVRDGGGEAPKFFIAWKADYRGRIYAHTPWLTPQGGDFQRALFEFHEGVVLNDDGVRALKRHGANLVARSRLLTDLDIKSRKVVTLDERERWVDDHEAQILSCAENPVEESFWREVAPDESMQFLAFCLVWKRYRDNPKAACHLPVQIDGTCNGLQHIAALTGDFDLGQAVNVIPREDGLPGDIYVEVAEMAKGQLATMRIIGLPETAESLVGPVNQLLQAIAGDLENWIDRGTAKRVVMTIPYGASAGTQSGFVIESIAARFDDELARVNRRSPDLLESNLARLGQEFETLRAANLRVKWFKAMLGSRRALRRAVAKWRQEPVGNCDGKDNVNEERSFLGQLDAAVSAEFSTKNRGDAWNRWCGAAVIIGIIASAIVKAERKALTQLYPRADEFGSWLKSIGKRCEGLPMAWNTPLGFPVCQDAFKEQKTSFSVRITSKDPVTIGYSRMLEQNLAGGQSSRLLPNLIHSMDATHLAMAITGAQSLGLIHFGSIHDCLLCRPNEAEQWKAVLSESFIKLYARSEGRASVLASWAGWMKTIAELAGRPAEPVAKFDGFLRYPDQQAERRDLGAPTIELLNRIRSLQGVEGQIAWQLVSYRNGGDYIAPKVERKGEPPTQIEWNPYGADDAGFDIAKVRDSAYFFS